MSLALYTHSVCLLAVYAATRHSIKTYVAILALARSVKDDPSSIPAFEAKVEEPIVPQRPTRPWWRKLFTAAGLKVLALPILIFSIQIFLVSVLPRISSQSVLDTFWAVMVTQLLGSSLTKAMKALHPGPSAQKLERTKNDINSRAIVIDDLPIPLLARHRPRLVFGYLLSVAVMVSAYNRSTMLYPMVAIGPILDLGGHMYCPKISIKRVIQFVNGAIVSCTALVLLIIYIISDFKSEKKEKEKNPSDYKSMSQWILAVIMMFNTGFGFGIPTAMLSYTLRYEYCVASASSNLPPVVDGQAMVPKRAPKFAHPIFTAGLVGLVAGTTLSDLIMLRSIKEIDPITQMSSCVFFGASSASIGLLLGAWFTGGFNEWWNHTDEWFPALDSAEDTTPSVANADEEKALSPEDAQRVEDLIQLEDDRSDMII